MYNGTPVNRHPSTADTRYKGLNDFIYGPLFPNDLFPIKFPNSVLIPTHEGHTNHTFFMATSWGDKLVSVFVL